VIIIAVVALHQFITIHHCQVKYIVMNLLYLMVLLEAICKRYNSGRLDVKDSVWGIDVLEVEFQDSGIEDISTIFNCY
jgi:hypothetical protein